MGYLECDESVIIFASELPRSTDQSHNINFFKQNFDPESKTAVDDGRQR